MTRKGNSEGPRCILTSRPQGIAAREVEIYQIRQRRRRLEAFSKTFDEGVKKALSNSRAGQYVKFGSPRDNGPILFVASVVRSKCRYYGV